MDYCCCSATQTCPTLVTPWTASMLGFLLFTISQSCLKFMSIELAMPSSYLVLCRPLLLLPSSFTASGSFLMTRFFTSGGQSVGASDSASVLPMNIQDWFPLGWTGSPCSPRDSQESSPTPQFKSINSLVLSFF